MKALVIVLSVIVGIALIVGAWFGYWALARANQTQQYGVNTDGQQYQAGLISQERDRVTAYNVATDPGQKKSIADQFCAVYLDLTKPPTDLVAAYDDICL